MVFDMNPRLLFSLIRKYAENKHYTCANAHIHIAARAMHKHIYTHHIKERRERENLFSDFKINLEKEDNKINNKNYNNNYFKNIIISIKKDRDIILHIYFSTSFFFCN